MAKTTRITEQLTWAALRESFFIGNRIVEELVIKDSKPVMKDGKPVTKEVTKFCNDLTTAIDNGTLDKLIQECADVYYAGDTSTVLAILARNLDSKRHNIKNQVSNSARQSDVIRLETLSNYVAARRGISKREGKLPQWAYGPAEIDAIDDPAVLQKVINSINDVCCDKASGAYSKHLGDDYVQTAEANRAYARKRKAELLQKQRSKAPDELLSKLERGETLTAEEAAMVIKLLSK